MSEWGRTGFAVPYDSSGWLFRGDGITDIVKQTTVWQLDEGNNHLCTISVSLVSNIMYESNPLLVCANLEKLKLILKHNMLHNYVLCFFFKLYLFIYLFEGI